MNKKQLQQKAETAFIVHLLQEESLKLLYMKKMINYFDDRVISNDVEQE
jgi:hypothetical protein